MLNATATFLTSLGQALSAQHLYQDGHPMRETARRRALECLLDVLGERGAIRFSFLDGAVIVGTRVMTELKGWEWAPRLAAVGVQRLEVDSVPMPTASDMEILVQELHQRLGHGADHGATVALRGFRFGPLGVATAPDEHDQAAGDLLDALAQLPMTEEASAVRWIHDEIAAGGDVPLAEVEAVVHSLAMAIHREQAIVLPLLDIKTFDQYTTTHSCNVAMLSMGLAEQLGLAAADSRALGVAALLHDIGKVRVPVEVLVKPGRLTEVEFAQMQTHTVEGARLLSARARGHGLASVVAYEHHVWENREGGYPSMAYARPCHYASRIVHVCDLYDALSTRRPYREAWPRARTIGMLQQQAGIEVDAEIVHAFVALLARAEETRAAVRDEAPTSGWSADVAATARQLHEEAAADAAA
ncbi:MAG: HD domain-containing protein [Gemmatimonadaceae bacterium]|jgi:putative nucleotidyltransferase with HDIG domain|nr:HD domain-containing protein [Gemmatimonadaceae bacterium]